MENEQLDYAAAGARMGYKEVDDYGPNYTQETGGGAKIHPMTFPEPEKPAQQAETKPDEHISSEALAQMGVAESDIAELQPIAAKLGKDGTEQLLKIHNGIQERQEAEWSQQNETWVSDLTAEYGEGLEVAADTVNEVIKQYDTGGELVNLLKRTGTQNCAPLFRFVHNISRDLNRRWR